MKRSNEPIPWALFGAGGMLLALIGPGLVLATGFLLPFAEPSRAFQAIDAIVAEPAGKLFILALIALPLFHTVHRLYHGMHDLHVPLPRPLRLALCYGTATLLSVVSGSWLLLL